MVDIVGCVGNPSLGSLSDISVFSAWFRRVCVGVFFLLVESRCHAEGFSAQRIVVLLGLNFFGIACKWTPKEKRKANSLLQMSLLS